VIQFVCLKCAARESEIRLRERTRSPSTAVAYADRQQPRHQTYLTLLSERFYWKRSATRIQSIRSAVVLLHTASTAQPTISRSPTQQPLSNSVATTSLKSILAADSTAVQFKSQSPRVSHGDGDNSWLTRRTKRSFLKTSTALRHALPVPLHSDP
jgi:hypothetical protein